MLGYWDGWIGIGWIPHCQEKKYAEAKAEYDEGIKRNPKEQRHCSVALLWVCLKMEYAPKGQFW